MSLSPSRSPLALVAFLVFGLVAPAGAQAFHQQSKLVASDGEFAAYFGVAVAISGDTILAGAYAATHPGIGEAGSAYVFVRDGDVWTQQAELMAPDASGSAEFGHAVAISGNTAVVGARRGHSPGADYSGAAYVFVRSGTSWTFQAKLVASDAAWEDRFGISVAVDGDRIVVGAPSNDQPAADEVGAAYVFERQGTLWTEQAKLVPSDAGWGRSAGESVAVSGETVLVGAPTGPFVPDPGAAYVYVRSGGTWTEQVKLVASDGEIHDALGSSVAIQGDTALVGAWNDSYGSGFGQGSVYVYQRSGSDWLEQAKLVASDAGNGNGFTPVAMWGDTALVGAQYHAHVPGVSAGTAYVFTNTGSAWTEDAELLASDGASSDSFGVSTGMWGGTFVVGAPTDSNQNGTAAGAVYVFAEGPAPCWTLDFQTRDDFATPLRNGEHVDVEFDRLLSVTSSGPNAGAGIFDSTIGGPNDPSQDPDLLAHTGNVLVLQTENLPPDADDVFPRPNDDEDGGTLRFDFRSPIEARSLRLLDIDATDGTSRVLLTDANGRQRTYSVPAGWTGDRMLLQPGQGTLDLTTLAPQPGFAAVATAVQQSRFDADAVFQIDVELDGSGAVDDVAWCAPGSDAPQASALSRNGTGINPVRLSSPARPVIGGTWVLRLDCSGAANGLAAAIVTGQPTSAMTRLGEVLVAGPRLLARVQHHQGSVVVFAQPIPSDTSLAGFAACAQGLCTGGAGTPLTNAVDIVLGY